MFAEHNFYKEAQTECAVKFSMNSFVPLADVAIYSIEWFDFPFINGVFNQ